MKKILGLLIIFQLFFIYLLAQPAALPPVDKSPLDISYFPANYPVLKIQDKITEPLMARIIYSRPQKSGRTVFGGLVKYGEVWRMGANEATEIEFFKQVKIGDKKISNGRYTVYAIPNENNWTFIINKETDTWGAFKYNQDKDVIRTNVRVIKTDDNIESMTMVFEKTILGFNLIIAWENTKVVVPISF